MGYTASELIKIAEAEVGYLEKKTNSNLDSKTANAGYNNYTKYARDLHKAGYYQANKQGYAWCDMFVDWCFYQLCGKDAKKAEDIICQTGDYGAGCTYSMRYYKNAGRLFTTPKPGDQIFFGTSSNVTHTGIVYKVDANKVYTIEGNTSSEAGVVANGGAVRKKSYALSYSKICGYGRPKYDAEPKEEPKATKTVTQLAREVLNGKWGTGADRKKRLTEAGYDYNAVQKEVNRLYNSSKTPLKSNEAIAKEVIQGKWGTGAARKQKLTEAGYNYNTIQALVNKMLK